MERGALRTPSRKRIKVIFQRRSPWHSRLRSTEIVIPSTSTEIPRCYGCCATCGMTGTKFGCGMALCGACTVHINGEAVRSCITSIDSIGDSKITTIEAIGKTPAGSKVQQAWLDREVPQC